MLRAFERFLLRLALRRAHGERARRDHHHLGALLALLEAVFRLQCTLGRCGQWRTVGAGRRGDTSSQYENAEKQCPQENVPLTQGIAPHMAQDHTRKSKLVRRCCNPLYRISERPPRGGLSVSRRSFRECPLLMWWTAPAPGIEVP